MEIIFKFRMVILIYKCDFLPDVLDLLRIGHESVKVGGTETVNGNRNQSLALRSLKLYPQIWNTPHLPFSFSFDSSSALPSSSSSCSGLKRFVAAGSPSAPSSLSSPDVVVSKKRLRSSSIEVSAELVGKSIRNLFQMHKKKRYVTLVPRKIFHLKFALGCNDVPYSPPWRCPP